MSIEKLCIGIVIAIFQGLAICIPIFKQIEIKPRKSKILLYILMFAYCLMSFYFIPNQLRFITSVIFFSLILYFVLGIKDKKVILYSFNTVVIMAFAEIVTSLSMVIFGINSKDIVNNSIYNLIANILIAILTILMVKIKFIKDLLTKIIELFDKNSNLINYLYIFLLALYLIVSKNGLEFVLKSNYYLNVLFVVLVIIVFVIIMKNESKYEQLKDENIHMYNHVTKYEKIITEQGKANHEFKNQLMVIRGYAQMNSFKAIEYIDSIIHDIRKSGDNYMIKQINNFPDGGIKGLLYYKLSIMEESKIKYELDIESGIKSKLNNLSLLTHKNITKILGVILDNAIEASKESKVKKILIYVTKEKSNVIFTIQNTYKDNIEISKLGSGYTSKGIGRGYGLRLVNDIINESDHIKLENNIDDNYFTSKLIININVK